MSAGVNELSHVAHGSSKCGVSVIVCCLCAGLVISDP